jgi:2-polyprenyl-3-methyl-5-hydroxy-6-metoxy-1,4-benzoquinol methylase/tetratricopeptide (TPR) repeat protein
VTTNTVLLSDIYLNIRGQDHMDNTVAQRANAVQVWDKLWGNEGDETWRKDVLREVYERVVQLIPEKSRVADLGGGVGILGALLKEENECQVSVFDHSLVALELAKEKGLDTRQIDFERDFAPDFKTLDDHTPEFNYIISTEFLEHLSPHVRVQLLHWIKDLGVSALLSVPNDRLGPDEEPQHTIKYTARSFLEELRGVWESCRVEVLGPFLLGVVGPAAAKSHTLSVTLPVRNESHDLAKTLGSFRGVADEMVVGVDPRTTDNTWEVAQKYAEKVFFLESPEGPPDDYQGEDKVHFAHIRNQCMDRCTSEWIFMTEGHEYLDKGQDALLGLGDAMPEKAYIAIVWREGDGQRWGFPWLCRNNPDIRYTRHTHNSLDFPKKMYVVRLPQVVTRHDRSVRRGVERVEQRRIQNRTSLFDDWLARKSENSLFYLAQEWREYDTDRGVERFEQFLQLSNNGGQRYQARLLLARQYVKQKRYDDAYKILIAALGDDWSRTEHWVWLGDLAYNKQKYEEAYTYYIYASTKMGQTPFTLWWIDLCNYTYLPAQRLAMVCGEMGRLTEACYWAEKVVEYLPEDAPAPLKEEAQKNVDLLQEAITK